MNTEASAELARVVREMRDDARLENGKLAHDAATGGQLENWANRIEAAISSHGGGGEAVDDPVSVADVAVVLGEMAEAFDGGEYSVSDDARRVLIDFAHGIPEHPLFAVVGHYFAQNPVAGSAPPPQPRAEGMVLSEAERDTIEALLNLAYAAWCLADNTEDAGAEGLTIERSDFAGLETHLDLLDSLPDDRPDYAMGGAAKARWSLRRLLAAAPGEGSGEPVSNPDKLPPASQSASMVPNLPGNWPEDASHENGDYEGKCAICGSTFYGHKRRVTCKVCASQSATPSEGPDLALVAKMLTNPLAYTADAIAEQVAALEAADNAANVRTVQR